MTAVKIVIECIDGGVGGNYNSNSGVDDSDDDNGGSGDSKGGGHIQQ